MEVTIKKIAEACGVSRGTVDRVLNNRGRVNADTEKKVKKMAEELGYKPNSLGKALAFRKKNYVIGVIMCSEGNEFYEDMIKGMKQAEKDNIDYNISVILRTMKGYDVEHQLQLMEELKEKINCLLFTAINDRRISDKIDELTDHGIGVLTVNTDIENSRRVCHIGANVIESGRIACNLLGILKNEKAEVGIATGSLKLLEHNQRIEGFLQVKEKKYPEFNVASIIETEDDDFTAYIKTKKLFEQYPNIDAIYIAGGGIAGICRAVEETGNFKHTTIMSSDTTPYIVRLMHQGIIKVALCQQPWLQGYKALSMAVQYLVSGISKNEEYSIIENQIKILENLH